MNNYAKIIDPHDPLYGEAVLIIAEQLNLNGRVDVYLCQYRREPHALYQKNQLALHHNHKVTSQMELL